MGNGQYRARIVAFFLVSLFGSLRVLIILKTFVQKLEAVIASEVLVDVYETS